MVWRFFLPLIQLWYSNKKTSELTNTEINYSAYKVFTKKNNSFLKIIAIYLV